MYLAYLNVGHNGTFFNLNKLLELCTEHIKVSLLQILAAVALRQIVTVRRHRMNRKNRQKWTLELQWTTIKWVEYLAHYFRQPRRWVIVVGCNFNHMNITHSECYILYNNIVYYFFAFQIL